MRVLLVEQDKNYSDILARTLKEHYVVDIAHTGEDGLYSSNSNEYDLIIFGDTVADIESREFCAQLRNDNIITPLMLVAEDKKGADYIAEVLDAGFDDYIRRSGYPCVIEAKLRALIRRTSPDMSSSIFCYRDMVLDIRERRLRIKDECVELRRKEYEILEYLVLNRGRIVSKEELLEHVWENGIYIRSNTLDVHLANLRKKLKKCEYFFSIKTKKGFGYCVTFDI